MLKKSLLLKSKNTSKVSLFIAAIAAISASLCCVGPLLLLALGISGMGNFSALKTIRPLAIAFTILFLSVAFWKLYLRPACDDPHLCEKPNNLRFQRVIFWIIVLSILILLSYPWRTLLFN